MKRIIILVTVLISVHYLIGMQKKKVDTGGLLPVVLVASIGSEDEVIKLQQLDLSDIKGISLQQMGNCLGYYAQLHNGDIVTAELFIKGPLEGQYSCTRTIDHPEDIRRRKVIPLSNDVFEKLDTFYKSSKL